MTDKAKLELQEIQIEMLKKDNKLLHESLNETIAERNNLKDRISDIIEAADEVMDLMKVPTTSQDEHYFYKALEHYNYLRP